MKPLKLLLLFSLATLLLTIIHHAYGALIYKDGFRLHVAIIAAPIMFLLTAVYYTFNRYPDAARKRKVFLVLIIIIVVVPIGAIGMYEGGYNHLLKNILYFGGLPISTLDELYPSVYELPNDFIFEITGIGQFVLGLFASLQLRRVAVKQWLLQR
jgi:asparagine N-glycosylation enzyme membrane subunit Stt3